MFFLAFPVLPRASVPLGLMHTTKLHVRILHRNTWSIHGLRHNREEAGDTLRKFYLPNQSLKFGNYALMQTAIIVMCGTVLFRGGWKHVGTLHMIGFHRV